MFSIAFDRLRRSIVPILALALCAGIAAAGAGLARAEQARNPFGAEDPAAWSTASASTASGAGMAADAGISGAG
jgi:hypothetical protein